jgi:hypothetical protein
MCLLAFLRGNGTVFPRRRLQFSFLRRKRHSIPAQKGTTGCSGRIWQRNPAQTATISLSAQKKILYSRAEGCYEGFRADWATDFRAEGYTERQKGATKDSGSNKDKDNIKQMNI